MGKKKSIKRAMPPRERRKAATRHHLRARSDRMRLSVFRSAQHIYAQIIDDSIGRTLAAASTLDKEFSGGKGSGVAAAEEVGRLLAKRAVERGTMKVVFDRGGYLYHGRVKALAEAARAGGLDF